MNSNIDEMIKSYSEKLMQFARDNNIESLVMKNEAQPTIKVQEKESEADREEAPQEEESSAGQSEDSAGTFLREEPASEIPPEDALENYATFKGRIFTGLGAYPVEKAKVILYKNDILHAFLVTDKNGETQTIKIEAYPEKNSLEPLSDEQRIDYSADVYADGFTEKKNLLVSAVGGSDVVLNVELTPESEGIS